MRDVRCFRHRLVGARQRPPPLGQDTGMERSGRGTQLLTLPPQRARRRLHQTWARDRAETQGLVGGTVPHHRFFTLAKPPRRRFAHWTPVVLIFFWTGPDKEAQLRSVWLPPRSPTNSRTKPRATQTGKQTTAKRRGRAAQEFGHFAPAESKVQLLNLPQVWPARHTWQRHILATAMR